MWNGEGLVQVELAEVEAGLARASDPEDAVGVGLVVAAEAAGLVHNSREVGDVGVEDTGVLGVGDDHARGLR